MTNDREEPQLRKLRSTRKIANLIAWSFAIYGLMLIMVTIGGINNNAMLIDEKHLTNPNLPMKDANNATYSFTMKELLTTNGQMYYWMVAGSGLLGIAAAAFLLAPRRSSLHKGWCPPEIPGHKYCPECGILLKDLRE